MKKTLFRDALGGIVIGLLLSVILSYLFAPVYHPLNPYSAVGLWMEQHHIHGALVVLYCAVIWGLIGLLFSLGKELFKKDWSIPPPPPRPPAPPPNYLSLWAYDSRIHSLSSFSWLVSK